MRTRWTICAGLAATCLLVIGNDATAQTRGNTGQNGQGGGSTSMFSGGGSSSAFGSSSLGGAGQSGFGQTGNTGFGQNRNTGFGTQNQNNGFLGRNTDPNAFIGRNNQGQTGNLNGQTGNLGRGNQGNRRQLDSNLMNMLNGGQQGGGQQNQQPVIRPRQKVAFEYPQPQLTSIVVATQKRIEKLAVRYPHLRDVNVTQEEDGTVVLRGTAPSESDAKVAENMLRLEPGVRRVRNELVFPLPRPESE